VRRRLLVACLLPLALAGCESSQDKSARLAKLAKAGRKETGVVVTKRNPDVEVLRTAVVHDANGTAAAVELRMRGRKAEAQLPLALEVAGARSYRNDLPGLAPSLTHVALLRPGERVWWVNDQVLADAPKAVKARVGLPASPAAARPPRLVTRPLKLERDSSGAFTSGRLRNGSKVEQRDVIVFAVAERAGKVVAAGRAGIERLKAGKSGRFKVFWIGDPAGARVRVFAPPTVLSEEAG
jgi:hypothetical protein